MATLPPWEPFTPYVPSCASVGEQTFLDKWNSRGVAFDLSNAGNYVLDEVVPSIVPGIVFGILALVGFLIFVTWACIAVCCACWGRCCKCCTCCQPAPPPAHDPAAEQQFIAGGGGSSSGAGLYAAGDGGGGKPGARRWLTWKTAFWAFFLGTAAATVGVGIWGLVESVKLTDTTVSDFWDIVNQADAMVNGSMNALATVQRETVVLADASGVLTENEAGVARALREAGVAGGDADTVASTLARAPEYIGKAPEALGNIIDFLNYSVATTIDDIKGKFEPPTMAVQETWRFLPIAIIFGVLVLIVVLTTVAVWYMTWPRTTALLVALLWLAIALLMLIGTGLLNGVFVVSEDGCLFAESFAVNFAKRHTQDSKWGPVVLGMLSYYLGPSAGDNTTGIGAGGQPVLPFLPQVDEQQLKQVYSYVDDLRGSISQLASFASSPAVQAKLADALPPAAADALEAAGGAVGGIAGAASDLQNASSWQAVRQVYRDTKEYVCCGLKDTANQMWIAWTVAGCLGFVLALLASARMMYTARQRRKALKAGQASAPGAAVLWAAPPTGGYMQELPPPAAGSAPLPPSQTAPYAAPQGVTIAPLASEPSAPSAPPYSGAGAEYGSAGAFYAPVRDASGRAAGATV